MNVLSLFDGIGCGREAMKRAEIRADAYYASEIEKCPIKIAAKNHPDIIEIGDVRNVYYDRRKGALHTECGDFYAGRIDLLMGGPPCTDFSSMGSAGGMRSGQAEIKSFGQYLDLKGKGADFDGQSYLFWEYVRLLKEVRPAFYLLENVAMPKKWRRVIDEAMGVASLPINSALLSAQNRPRLYWTNIPGVSPPKDRRIMLDDILDAKAPIADVSHCRTVKRSFDRLNDRYGYVPARLNAYNAAEIKMKACALSRGSMVTSSCATLLFVRNQSGVHFVEDGLLDGRYPTKLQDGRYNLRKLSLTEMERLQTLPDGYTDVDGAGQQKRSAAIGNGWTVDVIAHILSHIPMGRELNGFRSFFVCFWKVCWW